MKSPSPGVFALALAVACIAPPAGADQQQNHSESMNVSVTVEPTCTIDVIGGERQPDDAIDLSCRNFRDGQPRPLLLETEPREGHEVVLISF